MIRNAVPVLLLAVAIPSSAQTVSIQLVNPPGSIYATAAGINNVGHIVGAFGLPGQQLSGFAYVPATKKYTTFNYPGAMYTIALGVNDANTIVGTFAMNDGQQHGFFLTNGKTFSQFDVSGSSGTTIDGINNAGDFAGTSGSEGVYQGFVSIAGTVTTFEASGRPTLVSGFNASNNAVGFFVNAQATATHGFLRDAAGNITQIDYPGSTSTSCNGINDAGTITGAYTDKAGLNHGFVLENGNYRTVGTSYLTGINNHGAIVGSFVATSGQTVGFVGHPVQ
jgi:hypothetical protein